MRHDMTVFQHYLNLTDRLGDYVAFQHRFRDHMRSEMLSDVMALSTHFAALGLKAGDVYTIMLPTLIEGPMVFYALNRLGVRVNFVHPQLPANELGRILDETHSKGITLLDRLADDYVAVIEARLLPVLISSYETYVRADKFSTPVHHDADMLFRNVPCHRYGQVLSDFSRMPAPPEAEEPADVAVYLQGGGTTGKSKTIMLTNANLNAATDALIKTSGMARYPGIDTAPNCMPLFHVFGLVNATIACLARAFKSVFLPKFDAAIFVELMQVNRVVTIRGVPNLYRKLLEHPGWDGPHLRHLTNASCGGDNVTPSLRGRVDYTLQKNGSSARMTQGYGITECCSTVLMHNPQNEHDDSDALGEPLDSLKVEIWNDDCQPVADGTIGEIAVSGPTVMRGYLNGEDLPDVGLHIDAQGRRWMLTGDLGYKKGNLFYFSGRKKRLIIISGFNVYPVDIEKLVLDTGRVKEVCAVQGFDGNGKIIVRLFIVPEDGLDTESVQQLIPSLGELCKTKLETFSQPHDFRLLSALPRTRVGKVDFMRLTQNSPMDPIYTDNT